MLNVETRFLRWSGGNMKSTQNTYTAIIKQEDGWWIGWIEEVSGVNCQEQTREKLLETLKITLKEAIDLNRSEAIRAAESDYYEESLQA